MYLCCSILRQTQSPAIFYDYEIYMVRLLVATVTWHKSLQFVEKSNITLLPCLFMTFTCRFDYYISPGYYVLTGAQVLRCVFPSLIYITS